VFDLTLIALVRPALDALSDVEWMDTKSMLTMQSRADFPSTAGFVVAPLPNGQNKPSMRLAHSFLMAFEALFGSTIQGLKRPPGNHQPTNQLYTTAIRIAELDMECNLANNLDPFRLNGAVPPLPIIAPATTPTSLIHLTYQFDWLNIRTTYATPKAAYDTILTMWNGFVGRHDVQSQTSYKLFAAFTGGMVDRVASPDIYIVRRYIFLSYSKHSVLSFVSLFY
jgi:hypothetical protein